MSAKPPIPAKKMERVDELAARRIDDVCAAFEELQRIRVDHMLGFRVKRAVECYDVADFGEALQVGMIGEVQLLLDRFREAVAIHVVQPDAEWFQETEDTQADPAGGDSADLHRLEVIGARDRISDVPAALQNDLMRGDEVAHQRQDRHDDMFGHDIAVAISDFGDRDVVLDRGLQVGVVGADSRRHDHLELFRFCGPLGSHVSGPEGLGDHDFRIVQFTVEHAVGAVLA